MRLEIHHQARRKPVESVRIDVMQRHDGALVLGSGSLHVRLGSECWCAQLEPFQTINAGSSPHIRAHSNPSTDRPQLAWLLVPSPRTVEGTLDAVHRFGRRQRDLRKHTPLHGKSRQDGHRLDQELLLYQWAIH